jgi:hypothetical protein
MRWWSHHVPRRSPTTVTRLALDRRAGMFRLRVFTPAVNDESRPHAGAELVLGSERSTFLIDLAHWPIASYQSQWRAGIARLVSGSPTSALMIAYRGTTGLPHVMWGLWRDYTYVYAQQLSLLPSELDSPFDPQHPYPHVGEHVPASEQRLPIPELRVEIKYLIAASLGFRGPLDLR